MTVSVSTLANGLWPITQRMFRKNELTHYERDVMMNILGRIGRNEGAFPSQETISADLGFSVSSVKRALIGLVAKGFIKKQRRGFQKGNLYTVDVQSLLDWAGASDDLIQVTETRMASISSEGPIIQVTENFVTTNIQEGNKSKRSARTLASPLSPEEEGSFAAEFSDVPHVRDEIESIKGKPVYFVSKNKPAEMRRFLNFARDNSRKFNTPRSAAGNGTQPSSAALHNVSAVSPDYYQERRDERLRKHLEREKAARGEA